MNTQMNKIFPTHVYAETLHVGNGTVLNNALIKIDNARFSEIRSGISLDDIPKQTITSPVVAPGFIDLQINGARDVQFTDTPTVNAVEAIVLGARAGGAAYVLPTFTTAPGDQYVEALCAVKAAQDAGIKGILGMHLEGPFLSPKRPGIHAKQNIRPMLQLDVDKLKSSSVGTLLITLAPECQDNGILEQLIAAGIIVFAGHSEAKSSDIKDAASKGLRGATHLFNAMSQMSAREPGLVGSVLGSPQLFAGVIADGHHVDWSNIGIAAKLKPNHLCLVTDSMCSLEGTKTTFEIHGKEISLLAGKLTDKNGTLAGAHISLDNCVRNVIEHCDVAPELAIKMVTLNPATALGLESDLGQIKLGLRASMTLLSRKFESNAVIVEGECFR